jgi:hypothetical protein
VKQNVGHKSLEDRT